MKIVEPVTAQDEEFWMWQVVSHGAREIANFAWYPMNAGYESNGYGLIHLDGTLTDRAIVAGKTAAIIGRNAASLNRSEPASAQVAVFYDRLSYMVGGSQPSSSTLGHAERDSLMGVYRAFFEKQIPIDFVNPTVWDIEHLRQYKIIFLPYPVMLAESAGNTLKQYISEGGTVVAEARLAWNDERGHASAVIPGFGLDEVFGARETTIHPAEKPSIVIDSAAKLPGMTTGQTRRSRSNWKPLAKGGGWRHSSPAQQRWWRTSLAAAGRFWWVRFWDWPTSKATMHPCRRCCLRLQRRPGSRRKSR
jgi:beta-galactosidase